MDANQQQHELTDYALDLIRHTARGLVGTAGFTKSDVEDIQQDLVLDLLERLPKFNRDTAAYNTFVARVVERKVSKMLRHRTQEMRDFRREEYSLDQQFGEDGDADDRQLDVNAAEIRDLRTGQDTRLTSSRLDMQMDIAQALADLPAGVREVAQMLSMMPVAEVARRLGIPETTLRRKHMGQLRRALTAAGLKPTSDGKGGFSSAARGK